MPYRFNNFVLNESTRELLCDGNPVRIEPKVFHFLTILVRSGSSVVARDFFLREIWPAITVGESSLCRLVAHARQALGDTGQDQSFIQTVHGVGYRFVGEVEEIGRLRGWDEAEAQITHARTRLDLAIERGAGDLSKHVDDFVQVCQSAMRVAQGRKASRRRCACRVERALGDRFRAPRPRGFLGTPSTSDPIEGFS